MFDDDEYGFLFRDPHEGFLTVADLVAEGWTRGLIERHLGPENRRMPVDHWRNYSGKKAWAGDWVELVMMTPGFEAGFLRSAHHRKLAPEAIATMLDRIQALREQHRISPAAAEDAHVRWLAACANAAGDAMQRARRRGFRTPHMC